MKTTTLFFSAIAALGAYEGIAQDRFGTVANQGVQVSNFRETYRETSGPAGIRSAEYSAPARTFPAAAQAASYTVAEPTNTTTTLSGYNTNSNYAAGNAVNYVDLPKESYYIKHVAGVPVKVPVQQPAAAYRQSQPTNEPVVYASLKPKDRIAAKVDTCKGRSTDMNYYLDVSRVLAHSGPAMPDHTPPPAKVVLPYTIFPIDYSGKETFPYEGYIVYKTDTIYGVVTVLAESVKVTNAWKAYDPHRGYAASLGDARLKAIALYRGDKELHLHRLRGDSKHLWRQLHKGRINLYDRRFAFINEANTNKKHLRYQIAGQPAVRTVQGKADLVKVLNKVYGLKLDADSKTWKELFALIATLD